MASPRNDCTQMKRLRHVQTTLKGGSGNDRTANKAYTTKTNRDCAGVRAHNGGHCDDYGFRLLPLGVIAVDSRSMASSPTLGRKRPAATTCVALRIKQQHFHTKHAPKPSMFVFSAGPSKRQLLAPPNRPRAAVVPNDGVVSKHAWAIRNLYHGRDNCQSRSNHSLSKQGAH